MALPAITTRIPTSVGQLYIELVDDDGIVQNRQVRASAITLDQDDNVMRKASWNGDLLPHMTQAEKDWLNAFVDKYRGLAEDRIPTT
jgi:hypothetical protein